MLLKAKIAEIIELIKAVYQLGCKTNLWVNFSPRRPIFPKFLPLAADLAAA